MLPFLLSLVVPSSAQTAPADNLLNLSFPGDGTTLSGTQLLEASNRAASAGRYGASATDEGDATFGVPIDLPAALHAPSVSLAYNSGGGEHSWVANGWSIQHGLISVTRIQGQQAAQAYSEVVSPHRVQGGGFDGYIFSEAGVWKYASTGSVQASITYLATERMWVLKRDGVTTWLAPQQGVNFTALGVEPSEWFPVASQDAFGNAIALTWTGTRLDAIDYGGRCTTVTWNCAPPVGTPHQVRVEFDYGIRAGVSTSHASGVADVRGLRLEGIRVETLGVTRTETVLWISEHNDRPTTLDKVVVHGQKSTGQPIQRTVAEFDYAGWDGNRRIQSSSQLIHPFGLDPEGPSNASVPHFLNHTKTSKAVDGLSAVSGPLEWQQDITGDGLSEELSVIDGVTHYRRDPDGGTTCSVGADCPWSYDNPHQDAVNLPLRPPETRTVFCSPSKTARYGMVLNVDVDGDGLLDAVTAVETPQAAITLNSADKCDENAEDGAWTWEVEYAIPMGFITPVTVPAPYKFPSIGHVSQLNASPLATNPTPASIPIGSALQDGDVELYDMNGDGWLDVVTRDGEVYLKLHGRGEGWSLDPTDAWDFTYAGLHGVHGTVMWNTDHTTTISGYEVRTGRVRESYSTHGLRDLNGDGLVDFVRACGSTGGQSYWWCGSDEAATRDGATAPGLPGPSTWTVRFNTGHGFGPEEPWYLPPSSGFDQRVVWLNRTAEWGGAVYTCVSTDPPSAFQTQIRDLQDMVEDHDTFEGNFMLQEPAVHCGDVTTLAPALASEVLSDLRDFDGDGRPDYVDAANGKWYRNRGNGFGSADPLPTWMPGALSETWSMSVNGVKVDPDEPQPLEMQSSTTTHAYEAMRVADHDRDGMLDVIYTRSQDDGEVVQVGHHGVIYGQRSRPGLLKAVFSETGAVTRLAYMSSSYAMPSGDPDEVQRMTARKDLVIEVDVFDPVTEEGATRFISYYDGWCALGVCQGFEQVIAQEYLRNADIVAQTGDPDGVLVSETHTTFVLNRDHRLPSTVDIAIDASLAAQPGGGGVASLQPAVQSTNTYELIPNQPGPDTIARARLKRRTVREYNDAGTSSRWFEISLTHNTVGLPTQIVHESAPSDNKEYVAWNTTWASSADGSIYRPRTQWTQSIDTLTSTNKVTTEKALFGYDGGAVDTATLTKGALTRQHVCSGLIGGSACASTLQWVFTRNTRGAVTFNQATASDGSVFHVEQVLTYGFGDTVPLTTRNALNHVTSRAIDALGRVTEQTDPNGVRMVDALDTFGRSWKTERQGVSGLLELLSVRNYTTSTVPNSVRETLYGRSSTGALTSRDRYDVMDGFGEPVQTWEPALATAGGFLVTTSVKDAMGRSRFAMEPEHRTALAITAPLDLTGTRASESWHDGLGRTRWSWADGAGYATVTSFPVAGTSHVEDGAGQVKRARADTHGRVTRIEQGLAGGALTTTGQYTYDGRGRALSFDNALGERYRYAFDLAGRLRRVDRLPNGGPLETNHAAYTYDGPWVKQASHGATVQAKWWYDGLGRTTSKQVLQDGAFLNYTWVWDTAWIGARTKTTDPSGETRYFYDDVAPWGDLGRLTGLERHDLISGAPLAFHYETDFEGRNTTTEWPTGAIVDTVYDVKGWKKQELGYLPGGSHGQLRVDYFYNSWGQVSRTRTRMMGILDTWDLYQDRASPGVLSGARLVVDGAEEVEVEYGYGDNGWLATKRIAPPMGPDELLNYSYDALGRATSVDHSNGLTAFERYTYDAAGNLTRFQQGQGNAYHHDWQYDPPSKFGQIPKRTDVTGKVVDEHVYDSRGLITRWTTKTNGVVTRDRMYAFDGANRLVEATTQGVQTSLWYDVDDQIVREERGAGVIRRFQGHRTGALDGTSAVTVESVLPHVRLQTFANGVQTARLLVQDLDGHALFTFDLSNPVGGTEVTREITGLYGVPLKGAPANYSVGTAWELDGLHAQEVDRDNEVVHFGARHMLHRDGMWMQPEPLMSTPGAQRFVGSPGAASRMYGAGNPVMLEDRSGRAAQGAVAAGFVIALEVAASVYDAYDVGSTTLDYVVGGGTTGGQVVGSWAGAAFGLVAPGGGYSAADNIAGHAIKQIDGMTGDMASAALAKLPGGGGPCFEAGTQVATPWGSESIEDVAAGDRVLASTRGLDETEVGEGEWHPVDKRSRTTPSAGACKRLAGASRKALFPALLCGVSARVRGGSMGHRQTPRWSTTSARAPGCPSASARSRSATRSWPTAACCG